MDERHVVIVGGGVAGLSAGCHALRSGFRTTILEHNLALGGVCTAWHRGPYLVDGCIHWLTGGPFAALYEELGITPAVALRTIETWFSYQDRRTGDSIAVTRDLDALVEDLRRLGPQDAAELERLRDGARAMVALAPPMDAPETAGLRERLRPLWEMRGALGTFVHFRKTVGGWARDHLRSPRLRRFFEVLMSEDVPMVFLVMVLGYLERGYLSRPVGGTAAFRDALVRSFESAGGEARVNATVDEILVRGTHVTGVRLADGTIVAADAVISTSSAPETVLRLLGGRFDAEPTRRRLETWKLFEPIVLASFGVERPYPRHPSFLKIDGITPLDLGGRTNDHLYVRVENDDPCFAPPGHTVVQAMVQTRYDFWATCGTRYHVEKDAVAAAILAALEPSFPELSASVRETDIATPLTYWRQSRSWRGAYEGWMPTLETFNRRVERKLSGLDGLYLAGQWVEPGGGIPVAVLSGRQAVQLLCADAGHRFAKDRHAA